jgi:hypothetical protein
MSILDEGKSDDQLRRDQSNQQYEQWFQTTAILQHRQLTGQLPTNGIVAAIDIWEAGKPKRRSYFKTYTLRA